MTNRISTALAVCATVALLAGCGANGVSPMVAQARAAAVEAQATKTLKDGFKHVYAAAFQKCDANGDGNIDEYEAGPFIDLREFTSADDNKNGKLSNKEFMDWATTGRIFGFDFFGLFKQSPDRFFKTNRRTLLSTFDKLDADKNKLLSEKEITTAGLTKANLSLKLGGLKTTVQLKESTSEAFKAADKTGDGNLGQAEFEDFVLSGWISLINPNYNATPEPTPPAPLPILKSDDEQ